jgi:uncharacterized membrane protein
MQLVVLGFAGGEPRGEVLAELERLAERDVVRLVDVLAVRKSEDGSVQVLELERAADGAGVLATLTGLSAEEGAAVPSHAEESGALDEDVWYVADAIPPGTAAAVALIEHRWAIPLRDRLHGLGGALLAEAWVHPLDLEAVGLAAAERSA